MQLSIDWLWELATLPASGALTLMICLFGFLILGVYNRYLHPLSRFPGPFWSSITDLYKLSVLSSSDVSGLARKLHEQYGKAS